ncbi:DUF6046 domain-containing protein [Riemerella anatipestifer]|uniref:DUF6046 domain-containing protein n=1 Tax=Riemerella anatipestifer TaxID=34085 RepID=A0AAP3AMY8_RIEAN|nr:DUF6046 domain-containing protein [Riemerella anatipestifer]AZZ59149.1 hypothetical protein AWB57_09025 [Riemerella anatipestifer]MBT0573726.1 hypothetical protein [Riemerella anatipestifer]MCU7567993.1 DUF6046 domain-containing protein [Riemerella anatipestifer]MCW0490014.1 DUF6046 domain-containing protein [Riemerella anatipestifer]MCW0510713.1 DUF6046 domain-containing protein [Riemerella anatipestifer]
MIQDFSFRPDSRGLKSAAVNLAFRFGMQTAKPFPIRKEEGFTFSEAEKLLNKQWLTSLKIILNKDEAFIFNEVVMSVAQERNIVTTPLQGRDGTIKEFISNGDYVITVDAGVMEGQKQVDNEDDEVSFQIPGNTYPKAELERLIKILTLPKAIEAYSEFLLVFGITSVVVKSFSLVQETHSNRQSIQIQMLSDTPYEIKTIKEDYVKVK